MIIIRSISSKYEMEISKDILLNNNTEFTHFGSRNQTKSVEAFIHFASSSLGVIPLND